MGRDVEYIIDCRKRAENAHRVIRYTHRAFNIRGRAFLAPNIHRKCLIHRFVDLG